MRGTTSWRSCNGPACAGRVARVLLGPVAVVLHDHGRRRHRTHRLHRRLELHAEMRHVRVKTVLVSSHRRLRRTKAVIQVQLFTNDRSRMRIQLARLTIGTHEELLSLSFYVGMIRVVVLFNRLHVIFDKRTRIQILVRIRLGTRGHLRPCFVGLMCARLIRCRRRP